MMSQTGSKPKSTFSSSNLCICVFFEDDAKVRKLKFNKNSALNFQTTENGDFVNLMRFPALASSPESTAKENCGSDAIHSDTMLKFLVSMIAHPSR